MSKTVSTLLATLLALCCTTVQAATLDSADAGEYVLLNKQQQPTDSQMRFYQRGTQWVMDARKGIQSTWQSVCSGSGPCRLQPSTDADISRWQQALAPEWQDKPFHCINNTAFAFCRISHPDNDNMRIYWMIALIDGKILPMPVNRLR